MRIPGKWLLLAAAATMLAPATASAQMRALSDPVVGHPDPESLFTSPDPVLNRNKQAALRIQRELLKCNEWARAGEWLTDAYIQHNPVAASGLKGVQEYFINVAKREPTRPCPALSAQDPNAVVMVSAEGDYVTILTKRSVPYADDPTQSYTTTWFDTWRFVDGKADEHWDPATLPSMPPAPVPSVDTAVREAAERAAIEKLMWDYVAAADSLDADRYAAAFTPDGSFGQTKGGDALKGMINGMRTSMGTRSAGMHHIMSNMNIEFLSPTRARVYYYWQTVFGGGAGTTPPVRVAAVGRGLDDVVKTNGKWLIQSRNVSYKHPSEGNLPTNAPASPPR
jgi:predicted SnoaL-like aldol condensation-catalyzing enzyme